MNVKTPKSLLELSTQCLIEHGDGKKDSEIDNVAGVPYDLLKPVLCKLDPLCLWQFEKKNRSLLNKTDELWKRHCETKTRFIKQEFNKKPEKGWRDLYLQACKEEKRRGEAFMKVVQEEKAELENNKKRLSNFKMKVQQPCISAKSSNPNTLFDKLRKEKQKRYNQPVQIMHRPVSFAPQIQYSEVAMVTNKENTLKNLQKISSSLKVRRPSKIKDKL